ENDYYFPLWNYKENSNSKIQNETLLDEEISKTSNIKKEVIDNLSTKYKQAIEPEDVFNYIYAILYSNNYRNKYNEFLKIDFPKIPFTNDFNLFKKLSSLGNLLIDIHLLKSYRINKTTSKFEGNGDGYIKHIIYDKENKKISINEAQYFTNIVPEVYNYYIGGYQVLNKWLKERKDNFLDSADINHFVKIVKAIEETIKVQKEIDKLYPEVEKNIIEFN
ncbi:MAG TPA: DNA methyltransferase, partial [Actinobacteria bacterium]|nr:DNA methyltransferase [Actinomycetota bacterium]